MLRPFTESTWGFCWEAEEWEPLRATSQDVEAHAEQCCCKPQPGGQQGAGSRVLVKLPTSNKWAGEPDQFNINLNWLIISHREIQFIRHTYVYIVYLSEVVKLFCKWKAIFEGGKGFQHSSDGQEENRYSNDRRANYPWIACICSFIGSSENVPAKRAALGDLTNARWVEFFPCAPEQNFEPMLSAQSFCIFQRSGTHFQGREKCRAG